MALKGTTRKNPGLGIFLGVGVVLLAPVLLPILGSAVRPLVRRAVKGGMMLYCKGKEAVAEAGEVFDDLVAEVREEMAREFDEGYQFASTAEAEMCAETSSGEPNGDEGKTGRGGDPATLAR